MPHIEGRWYADANLPVINLHPHPKTIEKLYLDLIEAFHWKSFTVIYESGWYSRGASSCWIKYALASTLQLPFCHMWLSC